MNPFRPSMSSITPRQPLTPRQAFNQVEPTTHPTFSDSGKDFGASAWICASSPWIRQEASGFPEPSRGPPVLVPRAPRWRNPASVRTLRDPLRSTPSHLTWCRISGAQQCHVSHNENRWSYIVGAAKSSRCTGDGLQCCRRFKQNFS